MLDYTGQANAQRDRGKCAMFMNNNWTELGIVGYVATGAKNVTGKEH